MKTMTSLFASWAFTEKIGTAATMNFVEACAMQDPGGCVTSMIGLAVNGAS